MKKYDDGWIISAKQALYWFIENMGTPEWERRRKGVIEYFKSIEHSELQQNESSNKPHNGGFHPIAFYDDWLSWYMYLIESLVDRPGVDEPMQSARIYPFFIAIGMQIDDLKAIPGIEDRLKVMINQKQNSPDSTLFELAVAMLYIRNGWQVRFLKEEMVTKTPDFEVSKNGKSFWVECKRMAKVPEYAEIERTAWNKRFRHLANAMQQYGVMAHVEIIFKVPVEDTPEESLGGAFYHYFKSGRLKTNKWLKHQMFDLRARKIDLPRINRRLENLGAREHSPQLIKVITGNYDMHGNYTQIVGPSKKVALGLDDGLHVLNQYVHGINEVYSAKWECVAKSSIDKKAKDVKRMLIKAVKQIPEKGEGIIHIGYETVMGPTVEARREEKTREAVQKFDFEDKTIEAIYCHAIQPLCKVDDWECAETTSYFEKHPGLVLTENILLDSTENLKKNMTHWQEDLKKVNR